MAAVITSDSASGIPWNANFSATWAGVLAAEFVTNAIGVSSERS